MSEKPVLVMRSVDAIRDVHFERPQFLETRKMRTSTKDEIKRLIALRQIAVKAHEKNGERNFQAAYKKYK
jgi:hypothetical protein